MEGMNDDWWLSFPFHESPNQDLAIRRFCPARLELDLERGGGGDWEDMNFQFCSTNDLHTTNPCLGGSDEVDDFVDSVINMDLCDEKKEPPLGPHQQFHQDLDDDDDNDEAFSMVINDLGSDQVVHSVDQGLQLVHLLLACAEALGCRDTHLGDSMLSQIWDSASTFGDSLQRVSYCFAVGLRSRLSLILHNVNTNGTFSTSGGALVGHHGSLASREEKMEAFHLLHQVTPYIAFGFMAANEAICEASKGFEYIHIVDLGMEQTLQWHSLVQALSSREGGRPRSIRLTGLIGDQGMIPELECSLIRLAGLAREIGVDLEFNMISEQISTPVLTRDMLGLREGEGLFVNSMTHLHKYVKESRGSLKAILQGIKKLGPALLTVVEQDANHNGPFFLGRFLESLHYYSAIFDSLEASLPRGSMERMKIERHHYAEEIRNIIAFEGGDRVERHERVDQWRRQLGRAGFQGVGLGKSVAQAKEMVLGYGCEGYTIGCEKGCLLLGWKGRPIMLASAWHASSSSSTS